MRQIVAQRQTYFHIYLFLIVSLNCESIFALNCQYVKRNGLLCHNYIPKDLPGSADNVEIVDIVPNTTDFITNTSFQGNGWSKVKRLGIATVEQSGSYVPWLNLHNNNTFSNMHSLKYLRLHAPGLTEIEEGAFKGLGNLYEIDLSGCERTSMFYLLRVLKHVESMPNLKVLKIDNMNAYRKGPTRFTSFGEEFFQALSWRNITEVHVRNTTITTLDLIAGYKICDTLRVYDFSFSSISIFNRSSTVCNSLETLLLTQFKMPTSMPRLHFKNIKLNTTLYHKFYYFRNIKTLNIDNWFSEISTIFNSTITVISKTFQLKEISIQNNLLQYLDVVLKTDALLNLEKLEVQGNIIQYLNGESFRSTPSLKVLNMSNNQFSIMQQFNTSHFEKMLCHLSELQILDLSNNGLTYIQRNSFSCNVHLKELYIRSNNIEQIVLNSSFSLSLVDLRNNAISQLNEKSRDWFDDNFDFHANQSNFNVKIEGNPFQCVCKYQRFLRWFVQSPLIKNSSERIVCFNHGKDKISPPLIEDLNETCERPVILRNIAIASSVGSFILISVTTTVLIAFWRRRKRIKRQRTLEEIIAQIQDGTYRFQFPVFLSYSNENADFVMAYIYPVLVDLLRQVCDTPRDLVCFGDRHFTPGCSIYEEMSRCLENSAVVINVVSSKFCQSAYCKNELEQAYGMEKPILLLFIEEVDENKMTPLMRELFRKYTRINMRLTNGEIRIVPSWETICSSVLDLLPR